MDAYGVTAAPGDGLPEDRQGRSIHLHGVVVFVISVSPASVASITVGPSVVVVTIIIVIVVGGSGEGRLLLMRRGERDEGESLCNDKNGSKMRGGLSGQTAIYNKQKR